MSYNSEYNTLHVFSTLRYIIHYMNANKLTDMLAYNKNCAWWSSG